MFNTGFSRTLAIAATLAGTSLAGCMGPYGGLSRDGMRSIVTWKNPDYGQMTQEEYLQVVRHAEFCRRIASQQVSGPVESMIAGAVGGAAAGAVGVGGGAEVSGLAGYGSYGPYGAVAGGANGANAGLIQNSAAVAAVTGTCTRDNMSDPRSRRPGVHVTSSYVRTRNSSSEVPDWVVPAGQNGSAAIAEPEAGFEEIPPDAPPPPPY